MGTKRNRLTHPASVADTLISQAPRSEISVNGENAVLLSFHPHTARIEAGEHVTPSPAAVHNVHPSGRDLIIPVSH